jgi:hypothetical protein
LGLACDVVFKRDHHLSNIEGSLLAFVVGDEEEEDLVAEASQSWILEEDERRKLADD